VFLPVRCDLWDVVPRLLIHGSDVVPPVTWIHPEGRVSVSVSVSTLAYLATVDTVYWDTSWPLND